MTLTRREAMLKALEDAGHRGCTRRELESVGGRRRWKQHLEKIEEAYYVRRHRSKFGPEPFRYELIGERLAEPNGETCEVPPQVHLFEPERFVRREVEPHWRAAA